MKVYLNLNEKIKVKINYKGYAHMASQYNELMSSSSRMTHCTPQYYKEKADKDGYTEMQFWEFVETFGAVTHMGFDMCYDPNILIETKF